MVGCVPTKKVLKAYSCVSNKYKRPIWMWIQL